MGMLKPVENIRGDGFLNALYQLKVSLMTPWARLLAHCVLS